MSSFDTTKKNTQNFTCQECGKGFFVSSATILKYANWNPKKCLACKNGVTHHKEENLTGAEVLQKYFAGPKSGVFTDGATEPNPGPGGWGAVYVIDGKIVAEERGHEAHTTNNRMELTAMLVACRLVPEGVTTTLYTDSKLCVETVTTWAKGWEARGWKKKGGPIKNLELIQELCAILWRRPEIAVEWIEAHAGNRWNEYADSLATAYRRP